MTSAAIWRRVAPASLLAGALACASGSGGVEPPPELVALEVVPDSARLSHGEETQFAVSGRRDDGTTVAVQVTWSTTTAALPVDPNAITADGTFRAGYAIGRYAVTATLVGGSLTATVPVTVHATAGQSVAGPTFWDPVPGRVHLCTSNHYTDDGSRGGVATTTASPAGGVIQPSLVFADAESPFLYADGSGAVRVECQPVWVAPNGLAGDVTVEVAVSPARPGSGIAKVFTYTVPCPVGDCRTQYTDLQDFTPGMRAGTVSQSVVVSATTGANIWFKSTYLP